ncbi:gp34 [Sodalis phage phiSG1]|nr:gp34 [Sodalis phage phiSG1]
MVRLARIEEFHERFVKIVEGYIRRGGKRTDKAIGELLGYRRQTIAEWRKKHPNFQLAILNPNLRINQIVDDGIERLATDGRVEVIKDGQGMIKEVRELPPTAQDYNLALRAGFGGTIEFNKKEQKKLETETVKPIRQRMKSGDITYLDAVDECEDEGIPVPESWKRCELGRIIKLKTACEITAIEAAQLLESESIAVPKTLMLEVQKEMGCTGEEINDIVTNLGAMMAE